MAGGAGIGVGGLAGGAGSGIGGGAGAPGGGPGGHAGGPGAAAGADCERLFTYGPTFAGATNQVALADLDGDHLPEIVSVDENNLIVSKYAPGGQFTTLGQYPVGSRLRAGLATGDVDGDGRIDVVVAHGAEPGNFPLTPPRVGIRLGNGDGTLGAEIVREVPTSAYWVAIGDIDGDHQPDLVVGDFRLYAMVNEGAGQFADAVPLLTDSGTFYGGPIAITDLNGDGRQDIVWSAAHLNVLLNQGQLTFTASQLPVPHLTSISQDQPADAFVATDLNGDGSPDIATIGNQTIGSDFLPRGWSLNVLLNDHHGIFVPSFSTDLPDGSSPAMAAADFDGDGRTDLALGRYDGLSVFLGQAGGAYAVTGCPAYSGWSIAAGDLDGNGTVDLALAPGETAINASH